MTISGTTLAFGIVAVGGLVLFAIGTPAQLSAALQARREADKPAIPAYAAALNKEVAAYAAAVGPHASPATAEAAGIKLRSVGFDLPTSDRTFPGGASAELMTANCTSCHSPGMVLTQPLLTQAEWTGEVTKMLHTYKAPVAEEDVPKIVAYLAALKVAP